MPSMLDLIESEEVKGTGNQSMLNLIEEPSTVPALSIPSVKTKDSSIEKNTALRNYFEGGMNPFQAPLTKGVSIRDMSMPEPPGGYDKDNEPLDESGVRYKNKKDTRPAGLYQGKSKNFIEKTADAFKEFFVPKAEEKARAVYSLVLADELGVRPSDLNPDLSTAMLLGFGQSNAGLAGQLTNKKLKIGKKAEYPTINPKAVEGFTPSKKIAMGLGQMWGDLPYAVGGYFAGGANPITGLAGAIGLTEGMRAFYAHELEHGKINSPKDFIDTLTPSLKATGKGLAVGAVTGAAGKVVAPLGATAKVVTEGMTMPIVSGALEGQLPTGEDIAYSTMLFAGLHGAGKAPEIAGRVKDFWVKTGRKPLDLVQDAQGDPRIAEWIVKGGKVPEDIVKKAQEKVDEMNKIQTELIAKQEMKKNKINIDDLIAKELIVKGAKVDEIKQVGPTIENDYQMQADELGVKFNGLQKGENEVPDAPIFTDPKTGSSFSIKEGQRVEEGLSNVRERFGKDRLIIKQTEPKSMMDLIQGGKDEKQEEVRRGKEEIVEPKAKEKLSVNIEESNTYQGNRQTSLMGPEDVNLVAKNKKGEDVGRIWFTKNEDGIEIRKIETDPKYQRKGVATQLRQKAEELYGPRTGSTAQTTEGKLFTDAFDRNKIEPPTEADEQFGLELRKELSTEEHPFRDQDVEHTNAMTKIFKEKVQKPNASPELFTRYLINEVNKYLNGEEVDIDKVRNGLSDLATRAEEVEGSFDGNEVYFRQWKKNVGEAARWARGAERKSEGEQLNMMIPVDKIPSAVKAIAKGIKGHLFRNREIFDKTGFWLGKDGKWRFELDDNKMTYDPQKLNNLSHVSTTGTVQIEKLIDYPELFKEVPKLKEVTLGVDNQLRLNGVYYPDEMKIIVRSEYDKSTILHEIQHAVNDISGSRFIGTNIAHEKTSAYVELLNQLKDYTKYPESRQLIEDSIRTIGNGTIDVMSMVRNSDNIKMALRAEDNFDAIGKLESFDSMIPDIGRRRYMTDPGEMEARVTQDREYLKSVDRNDPEFIRYKDIVDRYNKSSNDPLKRRFEKEDIKDYVELTPKFTEPTRESIPPWESLDRTLVADQLQPSYGNTLYMGVDPTKVPDATRAVIDAAKRLSDYTKKARGMKSIKPSVAIQKVREEVVRSIIDRSGNIRREMLDQLDNEGYEILQKMYLSKGASSKSAEMLKQMRKEVYSGLSRNEKDVLDSLILADRVMDIGKYKTTAQFKFPEGLSPTEAVAYGELFPFIEGLTPERAEVIRNRAAAHFEWMKKPLKDMLDAELITQGEYDSLVSHNYRRLKLVDVFDKRYSAKVGKQKRTIYDSGVEALSKGRETDIFEPSSEVMALEVFNRAYGRVFNNRANLELLKLARSDKENPFVRVKEEKGEKIPSGWDRVFVHEGGERKSMYLSPEMSKEWIINSPEISYKLGQFLRYASGSPILRTFATGINWGFALANLPRDIMHTQYAARVFENGKWRPLYSSHMPVYPMQMGRDLTTTFGDALLRKGRYQDYINEGGGMEFLVHQGRLLQRGRHLEGPFDKVMDFLGYLGETSEIMTRLAIRERALRQGKSPQEATFAARDYMDFAQGGGVTKALDNAFPYLNASIQGTRGLFRAFKDNPLESTYKLAQFGALVTGLYIASNKMAPKTMQAMQGNQSAENNIIIPLGDQFGYLDEKGQMRYPYIKVPLDQGQRFFKAFIEGATDKWLGNEVDVDRITGALGSVSPVGISSLPPTLSSVLGYVQNRDFWQNEDIWKQTDKPFSFPQSKEEFTSKTPKGYIDFGQLTGLSPERTKYAVENLVTSGTVWSWLLGQGYNAAFGDMPKDKKEMHLADALSKMPDIKRFIGVTNPYSQFAKKLDDTREDSSLRRWIENRGLDLRVEDYLFNNGDRKKVIDYIRGAKDRDVRDRLKDRFMFSEKIKELPNRSFWLALKGTPDTEARAKLYVERLKDVEGTPEEDQLMNELVIIRRAGGIVTPEFRREVMRLRSVE